MTNAGIAARPTSRFLALIVGLMLVVAACGEGASDSAGEAAASAPATQGDVVAAFQAAAASAGTPGAFMLVRTPDGEFTSTYGTTVVGEDAPPTVDTRFRAASITKTFTGTLILQLVDEGALSLTDPVSKFQLGVPNGDEITVEMLLAMSSGLFDYTNSEAFLNAVVQDLQRVWQPEELLAFAYTEPTLFAPGTGLSYSNTNYVLLGLIAEQVTGVELPQLLTERLLNPLGLGATVFPALDDAGIPAPASDGYGYGYGAPDATGQDDVTDTSPSIAWAAGALISTAGDLANWVEDLAQGALLTEQSQTARLDSLAVLATNPETGETTDYGLGLARINGLLGHNGQFPGFSSYMGTDPELGVTVVLWTNLSETPEGGVTADEIATAIVPVLLDQVAAK